MCLLYASIAIHTVNEDKMSDISGSWEEHSVDEEELGNTDDSIDSEDSSDGGGRALMKLGECLTRKCEVPNHTGLSHWPPMIVNVRILMQEVD